MRPTVSQPYICSHGPNVGCGVSGSSPDLLAILQNVGLQDATRLAAIKEEQLQRRRDLARLADTARLEKRKRQRLEDRLGRIPVTELLAVAGARVLTAAAKAHAQAGAKAKAKGKAKAKAVPSSSAAEAEAEEEEEEDAQDEEEE